MNPALLLTLSLTLTGNLSPFGSTAPAPSSLRPAQTLSKQTAWYNHTETLMVAGGVFTLLIGGLYSVLKPAHRHIAPAPDQCHTSGENPDHP